ncbi:MAG: biosynthetic-type acetolactate synthase large subunit [Methanomassiliicoccaceae archaeon]|nr:biosynthetic-type acetolactate synthase large subunit [Methanomassiliicoccaceae archaeon]
MKGNRALLQMLEDRGVETMFGYPGGSVISIYDEIMNSSINHVLVRHEQCAAHMADGYARASGKPGVCMATSGPGATNMITGIGTAYADSTPMLALTGQVGTGSLGLGAFQEVDAYSLLMAITKHNFRVLDVNRLPHAVDEAWKICQIGRPGPVHIDLPSDQMNSEIDEGLLKVSYGIKEPREDMSGIGTAIQWIKEAKRPVLLVGGGAIGANASAEVTRLAEILGAPAVFTLMGIGAMSTEHPLNLGPLGMHGRMCALDTFRNADLVIAIGTKFSDRTFSPHTRFDSSCRVVQIDIDATEFDKHRNEDVNLLCDAKKGTAALIDRLSGYKDGHTDWNTAYSEYRRRCQCKIDIDLKPIVPQKIIFEINKLVDEDNDIIITTDVGQNQMWAMHYLHIHKPRKFLSSGSFGTMGFGLPSAIGAKAAKPDSPVITITGDGGFQMVQQELATSVAEDLPVIIVLLNNGWLGMVKQWQKLFWNKRYSETELGADPDFSKIAEAYGARGMLIERPGEIADALRAAIDSGETCLLDIHIDPEEDVLPMLPANPKQSLIKGRCQY